MTHDSGSIVIGWLTRLAAIVALFGLLAFDGIALVQANFTAADHATTAAREAAGAYSSSKDAQTAYNAAAAVAAEHGEIIDAATFTIAANGRVTLRLTQEATTLWLHRIGPLKKFVTVTVTGEGSPPP